MAAFDHFGNMYDVAFKPRLLQTLIRDHLPDEKRPFSNPSELSKVVSLIKTHSLLSESFADSTRPKLIEAWKSALASWLNLIYSLLSTTMINAGRVSPCWGLLVKSAALSMVLLLSGIFCFWGYEVVFNVDMLLFRVVDEFRPE
ncbi:hypothetical protein JHK85_018112 [Glycine max]|nr:hypothetical protein JHK85_018112 [Glycine max]